MDTFLLALQFLTVIPVRITHASRAKIAFSLVYFPVIGLLLGLILSAVYALCLAAGFSPFLAAVLLAVSLALLTGGMHLDGLADTADALGSGKSKEEMLLIMRDPHVGVMGVVSLVSVILLKVALYMSLSCNAAAGALCVACAASRYSAVMAMSWGKYARPDGKARVYWEGMNNKIATLSLIGMVAIAAFMGGWRGFVALALVAGCSYLGTKIASRKIGGMTGDTMGAAIEINELIALGVFCI